MIITGYFGWFRNTKVKLNIQIEKEIFISCKCQECKGTGIFDCGIPEQKGICICCKGTGKQYLGTI